MTRAPAMIRWITSQSAQTAHCAPGLGRAQPRTAGRPRLMFPDGGTTRSNSTARLPSRARRTDQRPGRRSPRRPRARRVGTRNPARCPLARPRHALRHLVRHGGQGRWQPQLQQLTLLASASAANRSAGVTGTVASSAWCGRSVLYSATHASTAACAASSDANGPRVVEELGPERAVEPLHLPVLVRRGRRGQPMRDPVLAADLVEQHLPAGLRPNRSVNCLPLSVITSSGTPNRASACGERQAHRPAGRPLDHLRPSRRTGSGHRPR